MRSSRTIAVVPFLAPFLALAFAGCESTVEPRFSMSLGPQVSCARPAPLQGQRDPRAPGYIVVFRDGTPARQTAAALGEKYGFKPSQVYEHALSGFAAVLTDAALAGIRCEAAVQYVEHDGVATVGV
jgi:hypothetical protein